MTTILVSALILGLASNFHCLGMCGPIAMILPLNRKNYSTMIWGTMQYNVGRITSYITLGAIAGLIGLTVNIFSILQWLSIAAGIALILFAWRYQLVRFIPKMNTGFQPMKYYQKAMRWSVQSQSPFRLFVMGIVNGFLPCGMVYVALITATLGGNISNSMLAMLFFGVGTLPVMMAVPILSNKLNLNKNTSFKKVVPYMITMVGALVLLRGMNLGIPYVSPKVNAKKEQTIPTASVDDPSQGNSKVEMSCCHSGKSCD